MALREKKKYAPWEKKKRRIHLLYARQRGRSGRESDRHTTLFYQRMVLGCCLPKATSVKPFMHGGRMTKFRRYENIAAQAPIVYN